MTDPGNSLDDLISTPPPEKPQPQPKGHPLLAWLGILGLVVLTIWHPWVSRFEEAGGHGSKAADLLALRIQGQYAVGAGGLFPAGERSKLYEQLKSLNKGSVGERLRFVVLAGELVGPEEARKQLQDLQAMMDRQEAKGDARDVALTDVLDRLYHDYEEHHLDAPSVAELERNLLHDRLGWFGDLALAPPDGPNPEERQVVLAPARRTMILLFSGLGVVGFIGMFGFVGLVLFLALFFAGRLRPGITGPTFEYGGVYAESFALWMGLFVGLSFLASRIALPGPPLLLSAAVSLVSLLLALAWPLLRGVPWGRLRRDVGLTLGRNPPLELALGVACYAMAIPILVVGVVCTLGLMRLQQIWYATHPGSGPAPGPPSHPIVHLLGNPDWGLFLQLLLLASFIAPLVEETMFRGFLYRHLREATRAWGRSTSTLFSATLVSFLFAAIHPQGWVAIPVLMALALAFCLMREWRGTLLPSMIAHGINNGLVLVFFTVVLRS
jgi:membrane protease YdiL (CAAX protease family)